MDGYNRGSHSKHSLKVHLIFVTKYRKCLFIFQDMSDDIKQYLYYISNEKGYRIIEMETDTDHIHILLEYSPKTSISNIAKQLKQYTTHKIWKRYYERLSKVYWKKQVFWSDGYLACSIGEASQKTIEKYIQNQG